MKKSILILSSILFLSACSNFASFNSPLSKKNFKLINTDPVYNMNPPVTFDADRDPTSTEPVIAALLPDGWFVTWENTVSTDTYDCKACIQGSMLWEKRIYSTNLVSTLASLGWQVNTARNYSTITLDLNASRTPSATNDILVVANISHSNISITTTEVDGQIDTGNGAGFTTISSTQMAGPLPTIVIPITFLVPAGASYQLVSSGNGIVTILSINEIIQ